ncbi:hypothetical protein C8J56DRAFT_780975, partial [Mycena floridula]
DPVFPALATTGKVKLGEVMSRTGIETLLDKVVEASGVMKGRNGKFTTHCFRRGGAQYRFMWAEHKWSLKVVKWWGGWSSSNHVSHLIICSSFLVHSRQVRSRVSCATFWMSHDEG